MLDKAHDDLVQRVANKVYEDSRSGHIKITGFPDYDSVVTALRDSHATESQKQYQVTVKKHDKLVILQSLASKWLDTEFKDETVAAIEQHNAKFNVDGEYWHEVQERQALLTFPKSFLKTNLFGPSHSFLDANTSSFLP